MWVVEDLSNFPPPSSSSTSVLYSHKVVPFSKKNLNTPTLGLTLSFPFLLSNRILSFFLIKVKSHLYGCCHYFYKPLSTKWNKLLSVVSLSLEILFFCPGKGRMRRRRKAEKVSFFRVISSCPPLCQLYAIHSIIIVVVIILIKSWTGRKVG